MFLSQVHKNSLEDFSSRQSSCLKLYKYYQKIKIWLLYERRYCVIFYVSHFWPLHLRKIYFQYLIYMPLSLLFTPKYFLHQPPQVLSIHVPRVHARCANEGGGEGSHGWKKFYMNVKFLYNGCSCLVIGVFWRLFILLKHGICQLFIYVSKITTINTHFVSVESTCILQNAVTVYNKS